MEFSRVITTLRVVDLSGVKLNLTRVFMRAINTKFYKKSIKGPADTHEETNRQVGVVRKVANKIVQREF
jgi:hypothetical protein